MRIPRSRRVLGKLVIDVEFAVHAEASPIVGLERQPGHLRRCRQSVVEDHRPLVGVVPDVALGPGDRAKLRLLAAGTVVGLAVGRDLYLVIVAQHQAEAHPADLVDQVRARYYGL